MTENIKITCQADRCSWMRVYLTLLAVGTFCSLAIATTYEATRQRIARNRSGALQNAVVNVLPGAVSIETFYLDQAGDFVSVDQTLGEKNYVVAGYDYRGQLIGVAIEATGYGYQDIIRLLYGYSPDQEQIVGFQVLESRETPGLGDRVAVDKRFHAQIADLNVAVNHSDDALQNPIVFVAGRSAVNAGEVDGVSGATVTSRAITHIISESSAHWVPRIKRQVEQFRQSEKEVRNAH